MKVWKFGFVFCVAAVYSGPYILGDGPKLKGCVQQEDNKIQRNEIMNDLSVQILINDEYVTCPNDIEIYSDSNRTSVSWQVSIAHHSYFHEEETMVQCYLSDFVPFDIGSNSVTCNITYFVRGDKYEFNCMFSVNIIENENSTVCCSGTSYIWIWNYKVDDNVSLSTTCAPTSATYCINTYQTIYKENILEYYFNTEIVRQCVRGICRNNGTCTSDKQGVVTCICQRWFAGTYCEQACNHSLGLEDGRIPLGSLTASSEYSNYSTANFGRLNTKAACWVPASRNACQWIQADLGALIKVTGVITEGCDYYHRVTSYKVMYSYNDTSFVTITQADGEEDQVFQANRDHNTEVTNMFEVAVLAKIIRINPYTWYRYIGLRFEVLGCGDTEQPMSTSPPDVTTHSTSTTMEPINSACHQEFNDDTMIYSDISTVLIDTLSNQESTSPYVMTDTTISAEESTPYTVNIMVPTPAVTDLELANGITFSTLTDEEYPGGPFNIIASLTAINTSTIVMNTNGRRLLPLSDTVTIDVYNSNRKKISINCEIQFPVIKKIPAEHLTSARASPSCQFTNDGTSAWSTEGCTIYDDPVGGVTCKCSHLTSFAVLMDISPDKTRVHINSTLSTLSNVGLAISIVFLIITLITICGLKDLRNSERYKLLRHLVIALLCVNVFFSLLEVPDEKSIMCSLLAGVVQYSLLAAFAWMLIISTDVYMKVNRPFTDHERRFAYSRLIGWIGPVFIVVITAAITRDTYASNECWLGKGSIWSLIVPMCLILVIVTAQLINVGYITYKKSKLPNQSNQESQSLKRIRSLFCGILLLTPTLGLSWIFGFIIIFDAPKAMDYIFVILNTMQGFFIWLSQCVFSNEVRLAVQKRFGKQIGIAGVNANTTESNANDNTDEMELEDM